MNNNELRHYGIKGQKWGIRRYQNPDGTLTTKGKKRYSDHTENNESYHEDYKAVHDNKSEKTMSDAELKKRIARLNMEQQYSKLTHDSTAYEKGMKYAKMTLETAATVTALYNLTKKVAPKVKYAVKKVAHSDTYGSTLSHHGIAGQRWYVKNGPPYPLGAKAHSSSEKKAGTKGWTSEAKREQSKNSRNGDGANSKQGNISKAINKHSKTVGDADTTAYVATYATALLGTAAYVAYMAHKANKQSADTVEYYKNNRTIKSAADAPKLNKKMSSAESITKTNPDYPSPGTTTNCTFCTTALALRKKGYDVKANKLDDGLRTEDVFGKGFNAPKQKLKGKQTPQSVLDNLAQNGDGSYGNLTITWKTGGGHSIFWEVENGKTRLYDGQSGTEYTADNGWAHAFSYSSNKKYEYYRLDNCEPTAYAWGAVQSAVESESESESKKQSKAKRRDTSDVDKVIAEMEKDLGYKLGY